MSFFSWFTSFVKLFDCRFGATESRAYSIGIIYLCFLNLACSICYKTRNIIVVGVIPGLKEPSLTQLNNVLQPLANDFTEFQKCTFTARVGLLNDTELTFVPS